MYDVLELIMLNLEIVKSENMKILITSALKCFIVPLKMNFSQTLACAVSDACLIGLFNNYFNSRYFKVGLPTRKSGQLLRFTVCHLVCGNLIN